jgi:hypothetical protein
MKHYPLITKWSRHILTEPAQKGFNSDSEPDNDVFQQANTSLFKCNEWRTLRPARPVCQRKRRTISVINLMLILHHTQTMQTILWSVKGAEKCILMLFYGHIPGRIMIGLTAAPKFLCHTWLFTTPSICLHLVALRQIPMTPWVLQSAFYPRYTTACDLSSALRVLLLNKCRTPGCPTQTLPRSHNGVNYHGIVSWQ